MLSKLAYGALVSAMAWQQVTWLAGGVAIFGATIGAAFHWDSPTSRHTIQEDPLTGAQVYQIWRRLARERLFWLSAAELSLTTSVKRTNELLIALYWSDVGCGDVSDGQAAQLAAVWSGGVATSVLLGGWVFARLDAANQRRLVGGLLLTSALAMASLASWSKPSDGEAINGAGLVGRSSLVFLGGAGIGLAYYIPSGEIPRTLTSYLDLPNFVDWRGTYLCVGCRAICSQESSLSISAVSTLEFSRATSTRSRLPSPQRSCLCCAL